MGKLIAVDAGHGSNTSGKRTPDGYREHWINVRCAYFFEIALKRCGFSTLRIGWDDANAKDDSDVSILNRQNQIRKAGCDASVSWHANAYGSKWNSASGVETLIHTTSSKRQDSSTLAKLVQAELAKGTEQKNRGVKTGNFGMCNATYMKCDASILIEVGFMTNSEEAKLMQTDAFCKEQAEDACRGLCKYYGVTYKAKTTVSSSTTQESITFMKISTSGANLNCRKSASSNSDKLGQFENGQEIQYISKADNNWTKVKGKATSGNIITGYCSAEYLETVTKSNDVVVVNTSSANLNCRKSASSSATVVGKFEKGQKVARIEKTNSNWHKVKGLDIEGNVITGYCASTYLK